MMLSKYILQTPKDGDNICVIWEEAEPGLPYAQIRVADVYNIKDALFILEALQKREKEKFDKCK